MAISSVDKGPYNLTIIYKRIARIQLTSLKIFSVKKNSKICTLFNSQGFCSAQCRKKGDVPPTNKFFTKNCSLRFNFGLFRNTDWNSSGQKNNEKKYFHLNRKLGTRHVLKETKETGTLICSPYRPISERRNFDFWVFRSLKNEGKLCFEKSWQRQKLAA